MTVIIVEAILAVLCILRLFTPISLGVAGRNLYLFFINGISINFLLIWAIMMFLLAMFHIIGIKQKRTFSDLKVDVVVIVATVITLGISIL